MARVNAFIRNNNNNNNVKRVVRKGFFFPPFLEDDALVTRRRIYNDGAHTLYGYSRSCNFLASPAVHRSQLDSRLRPEVARKILVVSSQCRRVRTWYTYTCSTYYACFANSLYILLCNGYAGAGFSSSTRVRYTVHGA